MLAVVDGEAVRADALADSLEMPISTVYRYLKTLKDLGLLEENDGVHAIGPTLRNSLPVGISHDVLARVARPVLESLAARTGETALLVVRAGSVGLCIAQVPSRHSIKMTFEVGQVLPLHAGATSRVLLAYAPEELVERVLEGELTRFTDDTPDRAKLERQIRSTRMAGIATSRGEFIDGALAVAVPVFAAGQAVAGLAVAGPAARCGPAWQRDARVALAEAGSELGELLRS
jgi:DNA-binding IclR family transcriptional regulator